MLADRLKQLRQQCELTQKQIADTLSIDRSTYSYYETGKTSPPLDTLVRLAKMFNISTDNLLGYAPKPAAVLHESAPVYYRNAPVEEDFTLLPKGEQNLLIRFRQLSDQDQAAILSAMDEMLIHFEV